MGNKALQILDSIKGNIGIEVYDRIIRSCGVLDEKPTPTKQSQYVKSILYELEKICGEEMVAKVMKPCGYHCISKSIVARAKEIYMKSENIDHFLRLLNEEHIGGGKLHLKEDKIIGVYEKCYCGLPKLVKKMPSAYCNCSVGWLECLFSSVFKKKVSAIKIQSILDGSDKCVFEVSVLEY
jgi:predicted hydrocarbon binding protein